MTAILRQYLRTFIIIIPRRIILGMRNILEKSYRENRNKHFVFSEFFWKIVPFMR